MSKSPNANEVTPRAVADGIPVWCSYDKLVDPVQLVPNPNNPNHHPQAQIDLGARIIKGQGWRACIVVSNQSGFITKGHGRLGFANALGVNLVPVDYQDYATPELEWADVLADNRLAELAEIDILKVKEITDEYLVGHVEMDLSGFTESDLLGKIDVPDLEPPGEFEEINDEEEFDHICPKCGFGFNDKGKTGKKSKMQGNSEDEDL